ncbi:hypothetical protein DFP74_6692 [Nocardiopsis sp. Huas11]|uniref:hypothetical protein n=1 Tax=Nocardiopsis sp. Huas11 TaxID=2183912 RepID=UPI000EB3A38D|nr:hypothetical protein [Nocardiopsis sp. Huas11]RKR98971.1 hypothetical protein DFP74_6692 [Nocardiopsis sp. Huas11]
MTSPVRCVCAAALARARACYGHLEGRDVWASSSLAPGSSYRGTLRIPSNRPGYVHIDRGDPESSKVWHLDDITEITPD